jgi:hypothetical protein
MWKKVILQEERNDTIEKKKSICPSFILSIFEQLFEMTRLDLRRKKVKECIRCVKQAIINLKIVPSNEPCYRNRRHVIQVENRCK